MAEQIKDIIAERFLTFTAEDGEKFSCRLIFGRPVEIKENWFEASYQILGHPSFVISKAMGTDSIGALLCAIEKVNIDLEHRYKGKFHYGDLSDSDLMMKDYRNI